MHQAPIVITKPALPSKAETQAIGVAVDNIPPRIAKNSPIEPTFAAIAKSEIPASIAPSRAHAILDDDGELLESASLLFPSGCLSLDGDGFGAGSGVVF